MFTDLGLGLNALAVYEARADAELVGSKAKSLAGGGFGNTANLEHDVAGAADGYPTLNSTFTLTHTGIRRALGEGLLREDADVYTAATTQVTVDGHTAGLDLVVGYPAAGEHLQAEVTEGYIITACSVATAVAAVHLAVVVLHSFRH